MTPERICRSARTARRIQFPSADNIIAFPEVGVVGGLHHRYERRA